jgi:hypothetical protein
MAGLAHRPLIIAGNGPSAADPPLELVPPGAVVFRMNWFFLEKSYTYGSRVDAWFAAIGNLTMEAMLAKEIALGRYQVDRICTPMRLGTDGRAVGADLTSAGPEQLDSWAVIARNPRLARHFMSRPGLPTSGFQALGFALGVGFQEIYLSGIDLYEDPAQRYCYTIPPPVAGALRAKDKAPGYEDNHGRDTDVAFLMACLHEYPQARIYTISRSSLLAQLLPSPQSASPPTPALANDPQELPPRLGQSKNQLRPGLSAADPYPAAPIESPNDRPAYGDRNGRRCAYVTAVTSADYCAGAVALANSLATVSQVPLIALVTPDVPVAKLAAAGILTATVPPIANPHMPGSHRLQPRSTSSDRPDRHTPGRRLPAWHPRTATSQPQPPRTAGPRPSNLPRPRRPVPPRFASVFTKLHAWRLDYLDRIVFLDADTVVLKNIDDLFDGHGFVAAPDWGAELTEQFNTGLFATDTSVSLFRQMAALTGRLDSADGGDQGFLNSFFTDWQRLNPRYNTLVRLTTDHPALYLAEDVAVLHYVGPKPWQHSGANPRRRQADRLWLEFLQPDQLRDLVTELRGASTGAAALTTAAGQLAAASRRAAHELRFTRARQLRRAALALDRRRAATGPVPRWDRGAFRFLPGSWLRLAVGVKRALRHER